ncbi:MAG: alcohol dehydrogenase catalytic domain-containing protein, partial [Alphaproteobacteria bacterium]
MLAITVETPGHLRIRSDEARAPGAAEVLVRVRRGGICGTDIHILHGSNPFARYPRVIGHEFSGTVEAIGPG